MKKNKAESFQVEQFLKRFFIANQCEITESQGKFLVQLTKEMDKALMNRPFYWQYTEAVGRVGEPKELNLLTNPKMMDGDGIWIHFGSPFLRKMADHLNKVARFTLVYESLDVTRNTMLQPWLLVNICIMYEGKQKKEELFSIGLNLINGTFAFDMMEKLERCRLKPTISNHCYTISPLIKVTSGFLRIEHYLDEHILKQDHKWALDSLRLLREEIDMIHHFYEYEADVDERNKEIDDVSARLLPKISYEVVNGGLVYLSESFIQQHST